MNSFIKFVGIGGLATALQYALMILLIEWLQLQEVLASASAYAISAIFNYLANYYFTFAGISGSSNQGHLQTFSKFVVVAGLGLGLNTLLFYVLFNSGLHYLIAQVFATLVTLCVNFAAHKLWIYRK
jgi:putative flippase GtrA